MTVKSRVRAAREGEREMRALYVPRGPALEYAPLAVNLYTGCPHRCRYCYVPGVMRKDRDTFHNEVRLRDGVLDQLEIDVLKRKHPEGTKVLLCFACDPYPCGIANMPTRDAICCIGEAGYRPVVLTKSGMQAVRDFDLLAGFVGQFAQTLVTLDESWTDEFEPYAAPVASRLKAFELAHEAGITTWCSIEPAMWAHDVLQILQDPELNRDVDEWRIGVGSGGWFNKDEDWKGMVKTIEDLHKANKIRGMVRFKESIKKTINWLGE